ncbi:cardiolipin synthase (CMP-forming) [Electrophorus electricus]|uniref:cardiolipin synthase (CMP-forming) n=1 Tax=Electrophorus electricus TaxID=8005 RepID=UPI0015D0A792|nr:cardiolipin synthase (CMP-forming) [Electrophorus electricus]
MRSWLNSVLGMFLRVCKNNLVSCAKGHVPRVSFITATRSQHVWGCKGSSLLSCCKIQSTHATTETKSLRRLKTKFCCPGYRPRCMQILNDLTSTLVTGHDAFVRDNYERVVEPDLPASLGYFKTAVTRKYFEMHKPKLHSCIYSFEIQALARILSDGINAGTFSGSKGYCTTPRKPEGHKYLNKDARDTETAQRASPFPLSNGGQFKELYENPWTIPNILCLARILLSPVLGYLIMEDYFHASLGLFVLAGATDLLDGYIARNWPNQKSVLGSALDPLADKILISVLYISLTYAQLIPVPLTALVLSRDVALIAAVFYVRYKTVPPPVTLSKFFNPCYTTAQLKPTLISKFNTAMQLFLVAASLASPIFHYTDSVLLHLLWYVTALTTAASGYSYYHYGRKTVEVLNNTK